MLKEELCHNFNLRAMRPVPIQSLALKDPARAEASLAKMLSEEENGTGEYSHKTRGWHTLGKIKVLINGSMRALRSLWSEHDLSNFAIDAENVKVLGPTTAQLDGTVLRTLRGVLQDGMDAEDADVVYDHIARVDSENFSWLVRSDRILQRILEFNADIVVIQEYDVHFGPKSSYSNVCNATFPEAMADSGYGGVLFDGVLEHKEGIGIFWRTDIFKLQGDGTTPSDANDVVSIGDYSLCAPTANVPFEVKDKFGEPLPPRLRRHLAVACLTHIETGRQVRVCGVHFSPTSRDDAEGTIRGQELKQTLDALSRTPSDAIILAGDFNINLRSLEEEHILKSVREYEVVDGMRRFRYPTEPEFILEDAFGDLNGGDAVATSYTSTRNQMIDYVLHTPRHFEVMWRSELRCPDMEMPNGKEPSDHIALSVEFRWRD